MVDTGWIWKVVGVQGVKSQKETEGAMAAAARGSVAGKWWLGVRCGWGGAERRLSAAGSEAAARGGVGGHRVSVVRGVIGHGH